MSAGRPSKRFGQQQWCTLTIDEDVEARPEEWYDWRQSNVQYDVPQHGRLWPSVEDHPEPNALRVRKKTTPLVDMHPCLIVQHSEERGLELVFLKRHLLYGLDLL